MARTLSTILWLAILVLPAYAAEVGITEIRTGVHEQFHRFVVELPSRVKYKVDRSGTDVTLTMLKVSTGYPAEKFPSTEYIRVKALKAAKDGAIDAARLELVVAEGVTVKQTNWTEPFRIVFDVYPGSETKALVSQTGEGASGVSHEDFLKAAQRTVTFNSGWRWVYRKEVMKTLSRETATNEAVIEKVFKSELGLGGSGTAELLREAGELITSMESMDAPEGTLEVLRTIREFYANESDPVAFEATLRLNSDSGFTDLGRFLLGDYYERKGFIPEANGYYSKVIRDKTGRLIDSAAFFQRARLFFKAHKYEEAKKQFEKAGASGFPGSDIWMADTLMIKGELQRSWEIFSSVKDTDALDPVSLMSLGDMYIAKGNYEGAQAVFEKLRHIYVKDQLLTTFFALKSGDALLAEGRKKEAEESYLKIKRMLKGQEWTLAALSVADSLALGNDTKDLEEAANLYARVVDSGYLGSEITHLSLAKTLSRLGRYTEAMAEIEKFSKAYRTSKYKIDLQELTGKVVLGWIDDLYAKGEYAAVVEVGTRYGRYIPFGKKAESYLKLGKSFVASGIYTDAIESLDSASKIGNETVAEDAMMELGRVYLRQRDTASTERLYKAFLVRFPKTRYAEEVKKILLKVAFIVKQYSEVASMNSYAEPESVYLKARSLAELGKYAPAVRLFEKAASGFKAKGDIKKASAAYIGAADARYSLGYFDVALKSYGTAVAMLDDGDEDKSWARYRMAQCYSKLKREKDLRNAVTELTKSKGVYGRWAEPIFATTPNSF